MKNEWHKEDVVTVVLEPDAGRCTIYGPSSKSLMCRHVMAGQDSCYYT